MGEASVLREVLAAAEKHPGLLAAHADSDGGVDPERFETELLRAWIDLHDAFADGLERVEPSYAALSTLMGDTAKFYGARARRPTLRVYGDLAKLAEHNAALRNDLQEATAYYGAIGRKAARTRKKTKGT